MKRNIALATLLAFGFLAPGLAHAAGDPGAEFQATPGQLSWTPNVSADSWRLAIAGDRVYWTKVFGAGEPIVVDAGSQEGPRLPDGKYNWELRAIPTTESDDSAAAAVTSGPFLVQNGAFLAPDPSKQDQ